jgi:beta-ketoacyl-acyl-carrier-protein synthase II
MSKRAVAITGIGIVSPLGNNTETTWQNLLAGDSGIAEISHFDASHFPARIAAEVKDFDSNERVPAKLQKYATRFTGFALAAADEAFQDAGITPQKDNANRWGIVVGAGMMNTEFDYLERFQDAAAPEGELDWQGFDQGFDDFYSSGDFGKTIANSGLSLLAQHYQIKGYSNSVHTACASGGQALGLALQTIRRGDADYMLAGGFDSMIDPVGVSSFCLLGALSTDNESPKTASRPFDHTRSGFVLGEGAAFLILEDKEKAQARGAKIYALLSGEGNSLSSYRITDSHPSGDGALQAIEGALRDAGIGAEEVDYINAHGTSTKMNDFSETNAIKHVFKERAYQMPISSTKSQTGHLIAAAGAIEGAISALSIYHQTIPMTKNRTTPDPECDLDYVTEGVRHQTVNTVLSNSFGFGGSNSCLVFKHAKEAF